MHSKIEDISGHYLSLILTLVSLRLLLKPLLWVLFKTPRNGAQTTLYAALDPALKDVSGLYFSDCQPKEVSAAAQDDKTGKFLWAESEKWTGVNSTKVD